VTDLPGNPNAGPLILVVEDEPQMQRFLRVTLRVNNYRLLEATTGAEALVCAAARRPDVILLDLGLPDQDGMEVVAKLRTWFTGPILVVSARHQETDKIKALDAGADDYLTKPFQLEELIVRLRALIRRSAGHAHPRLACGQLVLDVNSARFSLDGAPLSLTAQEFRILSYFIHHPGKVITRGQLGEHVYEGGFDPDSNALDVLISRIRRKVGPGLLHTVRGQGFVLGDTP
jgi:two-component system OmpR family response regulator